MRRISCPIAAVGLSTLVPAHAAEPVSTPPSAIEPRLGDYDSRAVAAARSRASGAELKL